MSSWVIPKTNFNHLKTKEIYWLLSTIAFTPLLNLILYGFNGFTSDAVIDINVYDTYYVVSNFDFLLLLGVIIFFVVYFVRTLISKFKNLTANLILMISIIGLIIVLIGVREMLDAFIQQTSNWTVHTPASVLEVDQDIKPKSNNLNFWASVIFYFKVVLLIFLAYCGFKTGRHYKTND